MAFSAGTYSLPGPALNTGDTVSATENNTLRNDMAAAFNKTWLRDGTAAATANIPLDGFKLTGLAAGSTNGDSVRYEQLPSSTNPVPVASGGTGATTAAAALVNLGALPSTATTGIKNRIINGAMVIDQRNAGASVSVTSASPSTTFSCDRFKLTNQTDGTFTAQQSTTTPAGFVNSLLITSTVADASLGATQYAQVEQRIEGNNVADLGWGTANAQAVTLSFWVRSNLTGTFCATLYNSNGSRCYVSTYTINAANTWEQKTITVAGDTGGTWQTGTSTGIDVIFCLAVGSTYQQAAGSWGTTSFAIGTSGQTNFMATTSNTFYITGVQLEKGSTATSFDYRPYGTELALCQRYYGTQLIQIPVAASTAPAYVSYKVSMRAAATITGGGTGFGVVNSGVEGFQAAQTTSANQTLTFSAEL